VDSFNIMLVMSCVSCCQFRKGLERPVRPVNASGKTFTFVVEKVEKAGWNYDFLPAIGSDVAP